MTIAQLIVSVGADVSQLAKDADQINTKLDSVSGFASKVGTAIAGAFTVGAVVGFAKEMANLAGHIKDMSDRTGIGVERLQALSLVAEESGSSVDAIASAVAQLSNRLIGGDKGAVGALERLNLNAERLIQLSPDRAFIAILEAVARIENPMERSALMMELFGRSGTQFLPMVNTELRKTVEEIEKLGPIMKERMVDQMDRAGETWERVTKHAKLFGLELAELGLLGGAHAQAARQEEFELKKMAETLNGATNKAVADLAERHRKLNPEMTLTTDEATRIERELTAAAQASIKAAQAAEENRKFIEGNERAYRSLTNWIGEQYIAAVQKQIAETERMREEMNTIERGFTDDYLVELQRRADATQASLDQQEAAYRDYQNEIGLRQMEADAAAMEANAMRTENMVTAWGDWFSKVGGLLDQFTTTFEGNISTRWQTTIEQFGDAMAHGRTMVQGVLRGLSGDFTGWISAAMAGIAMIRSAWTGLKFLFGGGEEGVVVNPARDTFLSQWGDPSNKGVGGAGHNLAALLTSLGAGDGGGSIFAALQQAETMALFRPAAQAIVDFLTDKGHSASINFHTGGMVPGFGEVNARLLGGERVQSRSEVGDMRGMLGEMRGLRADILAAMQTRPLMERDLAMIAHGQG